MRTGLHTQPRMRVAASMALLVLLGGTVPASAAPTNARIEAARKNADAARERMDELAADLEERSEEYLEVAAELDVTRARIRSTEADLQRAEVDLTAAKDLLDKRAGAIYRAGGLDFISVVLGAADFSELVARIDLMRRVGRSDAAVVASVKGARSRIELAKESLESRRAEQLVLRERAASKRAEVDSALDKQTSYLAGLNANLKRLVAEERARQEQIAAEAAKAAAAKAAAANGGRGDPSRTFDAAQLGPPHPTAVAVARRYVGKVPYLWGGTTPVGFDCSGLMQFCYREIGISIPRTSRTQYRFGAYIPPDRVDVLQPGDLVFFGRGGDPGRVHHVGMYIGGGEFIHAPQTGSYVSVSSLGARSDYVGATRP